MKNNSEKNDSSKSYSANPDGQLNGKLTLQDMVSSEDLAKINKALSEIISFGWGSIEIIVDRGKVVGFEKKESRRFGKFK